MIWGCNIVGWPKRTHVFYLVQNCNMLVQNVSPIIIHARMHIWCPWIYSYRYWTANQCVIIYNSYVHEIMHASVTMCPYTGLYISHGAMQMFTHTCMMLVYCVHWIIIQTVYVPHSMKCNMFFGQEVIPCRLKLYAVFI